uniref:Uncharacterized protein n=1 Tax=Triticum urartu TaxID=4572 RepID=A0A8R7K454_TRIUA
MEWHAQPQMVFQAVFSCYGLHPSNKIGKTLVVIPNRYCILDWQQNSIPKPF